jgi:hypothetical protein
VKKRPPPPPLPPSTNTGKAPSEAGHEPAAGGERPTPPTAVVAETPALRPSPEQPPPARTSETPPAEKTPASEVPQPVVPLEKRTDLKMESPPDSPSEPMRLELSVGPAWLASPGGLSPVTGVAVIGRGRFSGQAGLELMSVFPVVPSELTKPEGTVEVRTALFGAGALFMLGSGRRFHADAALGGSALMIRASGRPAANVASAAQTAWRAAAHLRLGGAMDLNRWLSLRADVLGGVAASRTPIGVDETPATGETISRDYGAWGPAFVVGTIGVQAAW